MRNIMKNEKGQFVVIAAMLVAIMIVSISPLLHQAATYYTHEPWDEYLALLGGLELNYHRLVGISLADFTHTNNQSVLEFNLHQWQNDMSQIFPGRGIFVGYELPSDSRTRDWYKSSSFSRASAN